MVRVPVTIESGLVRKDETGARRGVINAPAPLMRQLYYMALVVETIFADGYKEKPGGFNR